MIKIYAFHGNPGHPDDWKKLSETLDPQKFELVAVDLYSVDWLAQLEGKQDQETILLGHSWGCYQILHCLPKLKLNIKKIILCAPYVHIEKPVTLISRLLLAIPLLGNYLIRNNHSRSYKQFVTDLVHPASISDNPYFSQILRRMADWKFWKKVVKFKLAMQAEPLKNLSSIRAPTFALFGSDDKIASKEAQMRIIAFLENCVTQVIAHAGHGLIWTHTIEISSFLADQKAKEIGYLPGAQAGNNVISYIEKHLSEIPDQIALRWSKSDALALWDGTHQSPILHEQITYRKFSQRISTLAQGLLNIGIHPGDRVIIFLPMSVDMYTAMFAVQRIGAIAVFLDSWARSQHLGASAKCVTPKAMISFNKAFELVAEVPEFDAMAIRILYGPGEKCSHKYESLFALKSAPVAPVFSEDTALITFTTGSTGTPKGANRTHRFLSAQHHALSRVIPYTPQDADMPAFPIFSLNNLASGVTTILPALDLAAPSNKDSAILAAQIIHQKITCTTLSPSMLVGLARYCKQNALQLSVLRRVVTGGAPISKDDVSAFYEIAPQTVIWVLYGSTEAEPMAHIEGRDMLKELKSHDPEIVDEGVNVGHISEDIDYKFIRIIDGPIEFSQTSWETLEVPPGQVGEFICTGDHVCRDYYNNPEAFIATKISDNTNRVWHRTGDLAFIDKESNLWIVGRVNNVIKRAGEYYFPVRAEILLKRFDFTLRGAYLGMPDPKLRQAAYVAIEIKQDIDQEKFNFESAKKEICRIFEKNSIPVDVIRFVAKIPMDSRHHSKVEYNTLRQELEKAEVIIA